MPFYNSHQLVELSALSATFYKGCRLQCSNDTTTWIRTYTQLQLYRFHAIKTTMMIKDIILGSASRCGKEDGIWVGILQMGKRYMIQFNDRQECDMYKQDYAYLRKQLKMLKAQIDESKDESDTIKQHIGYINLCMSFVQTWGHEMVPLDIQEAMNNCELYVQLELTEWPPSLEFPMY